MGRCEHESMSRKKEVNVGELRVVVVVVVIMVEEA